VTSKYRISKSRGPETGAFRLVGFVLRRGAGAPRASQLLLPTGVDIFLRTARQRILRPKQALPAAGARLGVTQERGMATAAAVAVAAVRMLELRPEQKLSGTDVNARLTDVPGVINNQKALADLIVGAEEAVILDRYNKLHVGRAVDHEGLVPTDLVPRLDCLALVNLLLTLAGDLDMDLEVQAGRVAGSTDEGYICDALLRKINATAAQTLSRAVGAVRSKTVAG